MTGAARHAPSFVAAALVVASGVAAIPASAIEGSYTAVRTRIAVKLDDRLTSQEARTGDTFAFETTSSAAVDGLFLPTGTRGVGVIVKARPARGSHAGELELAARSLELARGGAIAVGLEPGQLERSVSRDGGGVSVPVAGVPVRLGGGERDTNVVFERGTPFIVVAPPPPTPDPTASAG